MFYVLYATKEGFVATIHVDDYAKAETLYGALGSHDDYSYVQMGAVGTGLISDIWHKHESGFGVANAEQMELPVVSYKISLTPEEQERNVQAYARKLGLTS